MTRSARVPSFAKLNLSLRVLDRRPDGYHELRTIFQTISLHDDIHISFTPGRKTEIAVECEPHIPDNLVERAACLVAEAAPLGGALRLRLEKRIPLGGGLGGGSSNAAAVLLALPVLAGLRIPFGNLLEMASRLGSDVPFFLLGGAALGLGRGEELYPLPDVRRQAALVVTPPIHVSTPEAYQALGRSLTSPVGSRRIDVFRSLSWELSAGVSVPDFAAKAENDFEPVVFARHPELLRLARRLRRNGANPAMLSGSGASLFGLFDNLEACRLAASQFTGARVFPVSFVGRKRYRAAWWRALGSHVANRDWPPTSRYRQ
jgi:4-diphosphocytidyl-2-C-methyl-D-erythritol kinase